MRATLNDALFYLDLNPDVYLFPLKTKSKTPPLVDDNLAGGCSNDPQQIIAWHKQFPGCSWGQANEKSMRLVVDVDCKTGKVGAATVSQIEMLYKEFPKTMRVRTPSGGYHLHYKITDKDDFVFTLGKAGFGKDIDTPNYVVIPGMEVEGGKYEEEGNVPVVPVPQWFFEHELLGRARQKKKQKQANALTAADTSAAVIDMDQPHNIEWAIHYLRNDAPPSISGEGGEATTFKVACVLREHGISETQALDLMLEHYNIPGLCDPLWEIDGLDGLAKKVNNAFTYASLNAPGQSTAEADFAGEPVPEIKTDPVVEELQRRDKAAKEKIKARGPEKRYTAAELAEDWVYISQQEQFVRRSDGFTLSAKAFERRYGYASRQQPIVTKLLKGNATGIRKFDTYCYEPGMGELECRSYNLYRPSEIAPKVGDTSTWDEHMAFMFPDETDRAHVLNWLAWVYQNPGKKPKHMLIIQGEQQGTGKSFIGDAFGAILGHHNVTQLRDEITKSAFNGWAKHTKLIVIEEVRQAGRNDVARALHDMITQEWITINEKNVPHYRMKDYIAWLGFTNRDDAMSMDDSDRRYLVVRTPAEKKDAGYYTDLYGLLGDKEALSAIAEQLRARDIGEYNGQARAPETGAKASMIEAGRGDLDHWIIENLGNPPLSWKLVQLSDVISVLPSYITRGAGGIRLQKRVKDALRRFARGEPFENQTRIGNGERARFWALHGSYAILNSTAPETLAALYQGQRAGSKGAEAAAAQSDFDTEAE